MRKKTTSDGCALYRRLSKEKQNSRLNSVHLAGSLLHEFRILFMSSPNFERSREERPEMILRQICRHPLGPASGLALEMLTAYELTTLGVSQSAFARRWRSGDDCKILRQQTLRIRINLASDTGIVRRRMFSWRLALAG